MATVVNFIDTTLRAAPTRTVALPTAKIKLEPSAPLFKVAADGTITPSSITFTASFTDLDPVPLTFNVTGGKLTAIAAAAATLVGTDMTGTSATVIASATIDGTTYTGPCTITKVFDGATGADGQRSVPVQLQKWSSTAPAKPTGTSTLTWSTMTNGAYTGSDGWAVSADNPGTPGLKLYIATVMVSAAASATTTTVSYANATVASSSQNGTNGVSGSQSRTATVYQWAATIPAGPTGSGSFKWSDGTFGAAPTGWALLAGAAPSAGMTLWAGTVQVTDTATSSTTAFQWSTAAIMAVGYAGSNGQQGASYVTAYCATTVGAGTSAPAPTKGKGSLPAANSGGLSGSYSAGVPTLSAGQYQMQTDGIYDPATDYITWSIPYQSSLKVATLSAITANLGAVNAGSINLGNGVFTVDNAGNLVCMSITIKRRDGTVILNSNGLTLDGAPAGTKNSELTDDIIAAATTADWVNVHGKPNAYRVIARGGSASGNDLPEGVYINGATRAYSASRSYNLIVIRRSDCAVLHALNYDVYGMGETAQGRTAYHLAEKLNSLSSDVIVVIYSADEPQLHRMEYGLPDAMYRCGASPAIFGSPQFKSRSAYILVGIPGVGSGGGAEAYQGDVDNDTGAWCDVGFNINALGNIEMGQGVYTPTSLRDFSFVGDYDATKGAPAGTMVAGTLAETVAANAAAGAAASAALSDKISKTAENILKAPIRLQVYGGMAVGDLTWNEYGIRTGGKGVAITSSGLLGHNGAKFTFTIDAVAGQATFGGELQAATGTFGTVSIPSGGSLAMGQGGYDSGSGFWFGWVGGVPKMSIGAAGGSALLWDGNAITIRNPSMDAFTAYLSGSAGGSYANGSQGYGTLTVTTSGGKAPYRYQWVLSLIQKSGSAGNMVMNSATSQSASFSGSGTNASLDYAVSVVVTDANGRSYTLSTEIVANHGTPP